MNNKNNYVATSGLNYEAHSSLEGVSCFYCGDDADSKDYCPPLILSRIYPKLKRSVVKSCRECRKHLRDLFLPTLLARCEYLHKVLMKRFKTVLSMPMWNEELLEEAEIEGSLKRYIEIELANKRFVKKRLEYLRKNIEQLMGDSFEKFMDEKSEKSEERNGDPDSDGTRRSDQIGRLVKQKGYKILRKRERRVT